MTRYWYDSFPGVEVPTNHPILDPYGTPYEGPEDIQINMPWVYAIDEMKDSHAPYTTISQNRGGVA
jgi:hypothetical protein